MIEDFGSDGLVAAADTRWHGSGAQSQSQDLGDPGDSGDQEEDDDGEDYHGSPSPTASSTARPSSVQDQDPAAGPSSEDGEVGSDSDGAGEQYEDGEEAESPDYEQGQEQEQEVLSCEDEVCYSANSDIYHIEMGNQSIAEPRVLHIVVANTNPVQVFTNLFSSFCTPHRGMQLILNNLVR